MMSFITLFKEWPTKTIKLDLHRRQRRLKYPCAGLHWRKVVHRVKRIKDLLHCPTIQKVNQKRRKYTLDHSPATDTGHRRLTFGTSCQFASDQDAEQMKFWEVLMFLRMPCYPHWKKGTARE
jgi:hypothetical protein